MSETFVREEARQMDEAAARTYARSLVRDLKTFAHAPISGYAVCCVVRGASGVLYVGCNIEIGKMNDAVHAEQAAIALAFTHEETAIRFLMIGSGRCDMIDDT